MSVTYTQFLVLTSLGEKIRCTVVREPVSPMRAGSAPTSAALQVTISWSYAQAVLLKEAKGGSVQPVTVISAG
jgi:hypothetical protein